MIENILSLEETIEDALDMEPFMQFDILKKKLNFYELFHGQIREKRGKT